MFKLTWHHISLAVIIIFFTSISVRAQKTDKIYLRNGDVVTGEIKKMSLAILTLDMSGPGIISIKWEEIKKLVSNKFYIIKFRDGVIVTDRLDSNLFQRYGVTLDDIIEISRIKDKFLQRLSGTIDFGFNYSKSSQYLQLNSSNAFSYKIPKLELDATANFTTTNRYDDSILTKKESISLSSVFFLKHFNFIFSQIAWQKNTELGLDSRYILNGGYGKTLVANNHQRLRVAAGMSFNYEKSVDGGDYTRNYDGLGLIDYKIFYNSSPKKSLDTYFYVYPSFSDWGRVRMELDVNGKVEIIKDFFVGLIGYYNYDSQPLEGAASKYDYGINFSLSYKFGN
jgi:putative salt-induced outer membrane protein YdiY